MANLAVDPSYYGPTRGSVPTAAGVGTGALPGVVGPPTPSASYGSLVNSLQGQSSLAGSMPSVDQVTGGASTPAQAAAAGAAAGNAAATGNVDTNGVPQGGAQQPVPWRGPSDLQTLATMRTTVPGGGGVMPHVGALTAFLGAGRMPGHAALPGGLTPTSPGVQALQSNPVWQAILSHLHNLQAGGQNFEGGPTANPGPVVAGGQPPTAYGGLGALLQGLFGQYQGNPLVNGTPAV